MMRHVPEQRAARRAAVGLILAALALTASPARAQETGAPPRTSGEASPEGSTGGEGSPRGGDASGGAGAPRDRGDAARGPDDTHATGRDRGDDVTGASAEDRADAARGADGSDASARDESARDESGEEASSPPGARAASEDDELAGGDERGTPDTTDERVLVLLVPTGGLEPDLADGLGELLIGGVAARRPGVRIVGKEELQAQLGQDDAQTLECIGSMACLGRVGVQLGVVEVIAGTLARREPRWVFNLNRVDVRRGAIVGRVFREVEGDLGAVADALAAALPELYAPPEPDDHEPAQREPEEREAPRPATLVLSCDVTGAEVSVDGAVVGTLNGTLRADGLTPGRHIVRITTLGRIPWQREVQLAAGAEVQLEARLTPEVSETPSPWLWIAGGVAVAALGAALPLGVLSQGQLAPSLDERRSMQVTRAEVLSFYRAREREAIAADLLFALGGAALIGAVVAFFFPERHGATTRVSVRPGFGGALVGGRF